MDGVSNLCGAGRRGDGIWHALRVLKAFHGEATAEPVADHGQHAHPLPPISVPERLGAVLLIGITVAIGIFPQVLLNLIKPSFDSPLFDGLRKAGGF